MGTLKLPNIVAPGVYMVHDRLFFVQVRRVRCDQGLYPFLAVQSLNSRNLLVCVTAIHNEQCLTGLVRCFPRCCHTRDLDHCFVTPQKRLERSLFEAT